MVTMGLAAVGLGGSRAKRCGLGNGKGDKTQAEEDCEFHLEGRYSW